MYNSVIDGMPVHLSSESQSKGKPWVNAGCHTKAWKSTIYRNTATRYVPNPKKVLAGEGIPNNMELPRDSDGVEPVCNV